MLQVSELNGGAETYRAAFRATRWVPWQTWFANGQGQVGLHLSCLLQEATGNLHHKFLLQQRDRESVDLPEAKTPGQHAGKLYKVLPASLENLLEEFYRC